MHDISAKVCVFESSATYIRCNDFFSLFFLAGPTKLFQIIFLSLFHVEACNFFFVAAILKTCCHCYRKNKNG